MRKRRTRKEKIIAELNRKLHKQSTVAHMANDERKSSSNIVTFQIPKTTVLTSSSIRDLQSKYFIADLKKSLFLTSAIIALELFLFFILQKRIFGLSNIGF